MRWSYWDVVTLPHDVYDVLLDELRAEDQRTRVIDG